MDLLFTHCFPTAGKTLSVLVPPPLEKAKSLKAICQIYNESILGPVTQFPVEKKELPTASAVRIDTRRGERYASYAAAKACPNACVPPDGNEFSCLLNLSPRTSPLGEGLFRKDSACRKSREKSYLYAFSQDISMRRSQGVKICENMQSRFF